MSDGRQRTAEGRAHEESSLFTHDPGFEIALETTERMSEPAAGSDPGAGAKEEPPP